MTERRFQPYVTPLIPNTWNHLLERSRGAKMMSVTASGIVEIQQSTPTEAISQEQKENIFGETTHNLLAYLQSRNVVQPEDNLIDRLFVAKPDDYTALCLLGRGEINTGTLGVRLPNRLCLLNNNVVKEKAEELTVNYEDLLCIVGIHEIAHTLTYQENWVENRGDYVIPTKSFRRDGLIASPAPRYITKFSDISPQIDPKREGLHLLQEAMMQKIVSESLSPDKQLILERFNPYAEPLAALDSLMRGLGEEPFIRATFTREGFGTLFKSVEGKFGRGQFSNLLTLIGSPSETSILERLDENGFITH